MLPRGRAPKRASRGAGVGDVSVSQVTQSDQECDAMVGPAWCRWNCGPASPIFSSSDLVLAV